MQRKEQQREGKNKRNGCSTQRHAQLLTFVICADPVDLRKERRGQGNLLLHLLRRFLKKRMFDTQRVDMMKEKEDARERGGTDRMKPGPVHSVS